MDMDMIPSKSITDINKIVELFANVYEKSKEKEIEEDERELLDSMYGIVKRCVQYEDLKSEEKLVLSRYVGSDSEIYQRIVMRLLLDMHNTYLSEVNNTHNTNDTDKCKIVFNPVPNIFLNILDNITMKGDEGSIKADVDVKSVGYEEIVNDDDAMEMSQYMTERQLLKRKLFLFYRKYAPHRLKKNGININKIADKYGNNEKLLNERLMDIYGVDLKTMNKVAYKKSDVQVFMDKVVK